jgi:membrane-associated phospholipid phosphatase
MYPMFESLDISFLKEINVNRLASLDGFFIFISEGSSYISALIPIIFILFGFVRKKKEFSKQGLMIAIPYLLSVLFSTSIKYIIERPRPFVKYSFIQKLSTGGSGSFPSGHTSDAFSIAMIISLLFPKRSVIIPMFLWAALVGYSRMDLGVHYPSDVLGGALIGIYTSLFFFRFVKRYGKEDQVLESP